MELGCVIVTLVHRLLKSEATCKPSLQTLDYESMLSSQSDTCTVLLVPTQFDVSFKVIIKNQKYSEALLSYLDYKPIHWIIRICANFNSM